MPSHRHARGLTRREALQVGYSGILGLGLPGLLAARPAPTTRTKSVLIVFLTGAPSHLDTFDPKPDAPAEIRGQFKTTPTAVPGLRIGEHLPRLAARAAKWTVVRSLAHTEGNHLLATHQVLTGHPMAPGSAPDKVASREDWPCYAGGLDFVRPRNDGIPNGVTLPTFLVEGPLTWPGQHAGFLGPKHDPWHVTQDPNKPDFRAEGLKLPAGFGVERLRDRRDLLAALDRQRADLDRLAVTRALADQQAQAFTILASGKVARAFDLDKEPPAVRDRYGRHLFGQSLLLGRRLIEAGVPLVQANMGIVQNWDNHADIFNTLEKRLLPPLDLGVSALLDDLEARGLLETTLVAMFGEFGRTPKISSLPGAGKPGRDHWPGAFFAVFAGGGVRPGRVIGQTDAVGGHPTTPPFSPADLGATIYDALGVPAETQVIDRLARPMHLVTGRPITEIYEG